MTEKKDIYKMSAKEIRGILMRFTKTTYGRMMFLLAYFIPTLALLALISLGVQAIFWPDAGLLWFVAIMLGVFVLSFVTGTGFYYRELREFACSMKK